MSLRPLSLIRRGLGAVWWFIDAARRTVLNVLFLLLIAVVLFAVFKHESRPALRDDTALVLALKGPLVEEPSAASRSNALARLEGEGMSSVRLRDLIAVLDAAAKDPQITRAVLILDDFDGAGLASTRDAAEALRRFKASGKPIIAWGSSFDQRQYYLAAQADEVWMHPLGAVDLRGFGGLRNYYRDALDKLGVGVSLVRVGTFKSAAEPFIANGPSPAAAEADALLYNGLWTTYLQGIESARRLPAGSTMSLIDALPERLAAAGGDSARLALEAKQVDALKTRDELRAAMIERGAPDAQKKTFRQVSFDDYLSRITPLVSAPVGGGDAVGVVVAEGEIVDGSAPAGTVGGLTTASLIRKAREDDAIKALVLRVNSPGGSVFGSELVRRELELTREAGKPVVVSMGNVAASGGYWISMASDEVMADDATITGSIGVFTLLPHAKEAIGKLGVHAEGVTTTWLGAAGDPRRDPDPRFIGLVQTSIDRIYADFIGKVAKARQRTPQEIDDVGQGRVWTGLQAKERGLVDSLGGLQAAIHSAAVRAKLIGGSTSTAAVVSGAASARVAAPAASGVAAGPVPASGAAPSPAADNFRVVYVDREPGRFDRLLEALGASAARALAEHFDLRLAGIGLPERVAGPVRRELGWLSDVVDGRKPFSAVAHCLCDAP